MQYTIDKEVKIVLLTIIKNGYCNSDQRSDVAKALQLFEDQKTFVKGQELNKEYLDELVKRL